MIIKLSEKKKMLAKNQAINFTKPFINTMDFLNGKAIPCI
jgi:hypothetical protein